MTIEKLDKQLQKVFDTDVDDKFIEFCNKFIPQYPVAPEYADAMSQYLERCQDAIVTFCGGYKDKLGPIVDYANQMKKREVESGRWIDDEPRMSLASIHIARCASDTMSDGGMPMDNTNNLMLCIGLFTYATIACNDCFKAEDFRYIFCRAWWVYFGKILSEPVEIIISDGDMLS